MQTNPFFDVLWSRMAQRGDFPTLQFSIDNIFKTLTSDISVGEMAAGVLSDFSLSQKIIRLANSAMYRSFGGEVTTVSRAILVLGVDAISHLTLGVQLLDYFTGVAANRPQASKELKQALIAGEFTRALSCAQGVGQAEEAVVCTLMHHMSRLLLVFYFPEEWERIQALYDGDPARESEACQQVLGVTLEEIAAAAAIKWRLPALIAKSMARKRLDADVALETHADWLGAIAEVSSLAAALLSRGEPEDVVQALLLSHAEKLGLHTATVDAAIVQAQVLNASMTHAESEDPAEASPQQKSGKPKDALPRLRQSLLEIQREGRELPVSELAPLALESAMRALNFSHCFLMLLNPEAKRFGARIGFGDGMREKLEALSCEEGFVPDIFHFAAIAAKPLLFEDSFDKEVAHRVPRWYREQMTDARSILLAPVKMRNRCVAIICGDWGQTVCTDGLSESELEAVNLLAQEISLSFLRSAEHR
ncbi:HDOD domain-containing protein [Cupriavidus basilensis]|uniref:HDOD domain-containing protein n=1 Tax=Cupriavidus basilensis TaxID=68895 RepID=A0ABT6B250_9BURK|nr:HDOD domain-containing protein [Cupriavidus basilensis]MDF3838572.1 HDOD domain-containing protein [Cupriavidus basilensis]